MTSSKNFSSNKFTFMGSENQAVDILFGVGGSGHLIHYTKKEYQSLLKASVFLQQNGKLYFIQLNFPKFQNNSVLSMNIGKIRAVYCPDVQRFHNLFFGHLLFNFQITKYLHFQSRYPLFVIHDPSNRCVQQHNNFHIGFFSNTILSVFSEV